MGRGAAALLVQGTKRSSASANGRPQYPPHLIEPGYLLTERQSERVTATRALGVRLRSARW